MPILNADLDDYFRYHAPTGGKAYKHEEIRDSCRDLAKKIIALTPESREQSLAITKLREVMMWANAAIAIHPEKV